MSSRNNNGYRMSSILNTALIPSTPQEKEAAALTVLRAARDGSWPREETVQVLRGLALDDVPVVAAAFARHGIAPEPVQAASA